MTFPYRFAPASAGPATAAPAAPSRPPPGPVPAAATPHPGMPPADLGIAAQHDSDYGYGRAAAAQPDWKTALPGLADAWEAIDSLGDMRAMSSSFGAIDARNRILAALGMPRKPIDTMRSDEAFGDIATLTSGALLGLAGSNRPDLSLLGSEKSATTLDHVLAVLDRDYAPGMHDILPAMVTLLVLRHVGAGTAYDAAVLARYATALQTRAGNRAADDESHYRSTQETRHRFLHEAAVNQQRYRMQRAAQAPADDGRLPQAVRDALSRLADAYRLDMSLAAKADLVAALEAFAGVRQEPSADTGALLERLLAWHADPDGGTAPPPLGPLLGAIVAVGWVGYQDRKCLEAGTSVSHALTGHPALPDAMCAALRRLLPAPAPALAPTTMSAIKPDADEAAGIGIDADNRTDAAASSLHAELQRLVAREAGGPPGPWRLAQLLEKAIARQADAFIDRIAADPRAAAAISAELRAAATDDAARERIATAVDRLSALTRAVHGSRDPLRRAFALDLYRALGVPAADEDRASALNRVVAAYPAIDTARTMRRIETFARRMTGHGYAPADADALCATAAALRPHWSATRTAKDRIRQLHRSSLEQVLDQSLILAGCREVARPLRLGTAGAAAQVAALEKDFGLSTQALGRLRADLVRYYRQAKVDERARTEARYRKLLRPQGGSLDGPAMARASQALVLAIGERLKDEPIGITAAVESALHPLSVRRVHPGELLQMLRYFWRADSVLDPAGAAAATLQRLDALKADRCAGEHGRPDRGKSAEFNNAVRGAVVGLIGDRVEGFARAYADALEATADLPYEESLQRMQAFLEGYRLPDRNR